MYKLTLLAAFLTFTYADCNFDNWQDYEPNLQNCDLSGQDLSGTDFSYMNLDDANLSNSNLASCDFTGASMVNADLTGVSIWNTVITDALMCGVDISGFDLGLSMPITESDCFNVCGGSSELDECGVCDGDGTACFGCMDPFATNYSELAIYDDGSCEYFDGNNSFIAPSIIWEHRLYDNSNYPNAQNGLDNIYLDFENPGFNLQNKHHSCVEALDLSIICKGTYYHDSDDNWPDYNHLYQGDPHYNLRDEIFTYKLNSNGELEWFSEHGQFSYDSWTGNNQYMSDTSMGSIVKLNDFYYFTSFTDYGYNNNRYGFIVKINEDGVEQWHNYFNKAYASNDEDDIMRDIAVNDSSICAVGYGYSNSGIPGDCTGVNYNGIIVCVDEDSNTLLSQLTPVIQPYENTCGTYDNFLSAITATSNGDFLAFGISSIYISGNSFLLPRLIRFNESGIIYDKIVNDLNLADIDYNFSDLVELENGNILVSTVNAQDFATLLLFDQDGDYLSSAQDHIDFELGFSNQSWFTSIVKTNDNSFLLTGSGYNSFNEWDSFVAKMNNNLDFEWVKIYGGFPSGEDYSYDVIQLSNNIIIASGTSPDIYQSSQLVPSVHAINYAEGCMNLSACNFNPIATYDNGSCYFEDICGVCDGNDYDFCDEDGDGVNNFEQWGYGAYNLSVSDIPNDQGGRVYVSFDNSYFDSDTLQSRSETYTIERKDGDNWVVAQSFGAYGADSYTVEVTTLENNIDNEFRVIASMDEGNFLSFETISGQSLDNIAPGQPNNLSASFESGQVALAWDSSLDNDFLNYNIYRQSELYATTAESTFADNQLPNIPLLGYSVSATDVNGNESVLSDIDVLIYIDGDLNEDYVLNILDVVMMMEHIMGDELEDIQYADLNNDSAIDILDVVLLVQIILSENRADNE